MKRTRLPGGEFRSAAAPRHLITLEPRMMFDGAAAATAAVVADSVSDAAHPMPAADGVAADRNAPDVHQGEAPADSHPPQPYAVAGYETSAEPAARAIIFIDTAVEGYQDVAAEWAGKGDIVLIDSHRDGIAQVLEALAGRSDLDAIHFVSHGSADRFMLGSTSVDIGAVQGELGDAFAAIGAKLSADGDLLIYGCDVATDDAGQSFIDAIAARTGADVAASSDATGAAALGGDWELESRSGAVTAHTLVSDRYAGLLQLTNPSSAWTITGNSGTTVIDGVTATITLTNGTGSFTGTTGDTLNNIAAFSNNAQTTPDVSTVFNNAGTLNANGTITITFSEAVTNPIIHIDRLGGVSSGSSNSATLTLTTSGATLTKLSGSGHLLVNATKIVRETNVTTTGTESSLTNASGTAAGSVRVNGTFTTITFGITSSAGDGFELSTTADRRPDAINDAFTINRGQTLTGNLFANNGSGADADVRGDSFMITQVNGASFTVGSPISLATGSLTITDAATGAFTFVPRAGYPATQSFTYAIADANGGTDTATATITVNDVPTVALNPANIVTNGSFETDTAWTAETGAVEYGSSSPYGVPTPPAGPRVVEVESGPNSRYIQQTITTVVGQQYSYSLQATTRTTANTGDRGSLIVDGVKILDFTTDATWKTYLATFTATSTSTVIRIQSEGSVSGSGTANNDGLGLVVDDVQVRGINNAVAYTENGAPVAITAAGDRIVDFDNANLAGATVTLTNQQSGDRLLVNGSAAASGAIGAINWTRTDTVVTFTGAATQAQYEAALQAVQFENSTDNPGTVSRTITVTATDGSATSNTATVTVAVTAVNDAPVNTLPPSFTVAEDGTLALTGLAIADADANSGSLTVTLSVPAGSGLLSASSTGGVSVTGSGTRSLVLNGTLSAINAFLASAARPSYAPAADFNGSVVLTMVTNDGGNVGTGGSLSDTDTTTITITPVADIVADTLTIDEDTTGGAFVLTNDSWADAGARITAINGTSVSPTTVINTAPPANFNGTYTINYTVTSGGVTENGVLNVVVRPVNDAPAGTDSTLSAVEDTPYAFAAANFGFSDAVEGNAFAGIVVTTLPANGTLRLDGVAVTVGSFVTAAQIAGGRLTWQGALNANGTGLGQFTFQVRDDGGTANGGVDTDQSANTISFNVTAVNDAPAGTDGVVAAIEDTPVALTAASFGFSDPVEGDAFAGIVVSTLPANGTLRLNGTAVTAGTFVTAAQIAAGQLTWQGAADASGTGLGSFTFRVRDTGGTANGGIDTDASPNTLSFTVTPKNDAPAGTDAVLAALEDTPFTFAAANFGFTDTADGNSFAGVVITTLPTNGTVRLNGVAISAGAYVTAAQIAAGQLTWQGAANANGAGLGQFTFQVRDDGGTANGGVDTDQSANTISFNVTAVNDAPAGVGGTATAIEDTPYAITAANFGFSDVDGNAFAGVVVTTLPANGTLRLNGAAVTAGTFVTAAQIAAGQLTWQGAANANGPALGQFTFQVRDNGGTANGGQDTDQSPDTLSFTVTAVNDAPSGADTTLSAVEDTRFIFASADFGFSDPTDGNSFAGLIVTTLPATGTLQLNGVPLAAGAFVTAAQVNAGQLSWQPPANANGAGLGQFTFQVRDAGGTANGGIDTDQSPNTVSFTVAPSNDPPVVDLNGAAVVALPVSGGSFNFPNIDTPADRTATATVDLTDVAPASVNATVTLAVIDNSFRVAVNGAALGGVSFELSTGDLTAGETILRFADGADITTPWVANANGLARVEVRITPAGVTFWGSRTTSSTVLEQLFAAAGPIAAPVFTTGVNTIAFTNTTGGGVEQARGTVTVAGEPTAYAATFTEGGAPVPIAPAAAYVGDIDSPVMTAATITLTNPQAGDQLLVNGSTAASGVVGGIAYTRTATGVSLSGSFTQAQYADALRLIAFSNTIDNPDGAVVRDITTTVSDGAATSNTAHSRITVVPVNDPIANTVRNYTVGEDGTLALSGLAVADPDAGATPITVTLSVPAGAGTLTADAAGGVAVAGSGSAALTLTGTLTDINAYLNDPVTQPVFRQGVADFNGTVTLTIRSNDNGGNGAGGATQATSTATITITPVADIADDSAAVNEDGAVTIAPLANDSFEGAAQITAVAGQAIAPGGSVAVAGGTVSLDSSNRLLFTPAANVNGPVSFTYTVTAGGVVETATVSVVIAAVNDRPTLVLPGAIAASEDTPSPLTGITVADIDANGAAIQVTFSVPAGSLALAASAGVMVSGNGSGTLVLTGGANAINAAIAASALTYTGAANANGAVTLTVTVNDLGNSGIDPGTSGDANSEQATASTTITVAAVNDAPAAADDSFATTENAATVIAVLANDGDIDSASLSITQVNGIAIAAGGSVAVSGGQVRLNADGTLTFTPTTGFSGAPSFTYTVSDGALTSTATVFGVVGSINHAPGGTDATLSLAEDGARVLTAADFGYSDPLDGNAFVSVIVATVPVSGALLLNGVPVQAGAVVSIAQINAGLLSFAPAANVNGVGAASFTVRVRDDGGTANGGQDTDQSANTIRFDITAVNDAPSGADATLNATEDTPFVLATEDFAFVDPADGDTFAGVVITTVPATGALTLNGVAVGAGQFVTAADIAAGRLVWIPAADVNGAGLGGFTFQVRDTGGTAGGGVDTDASPNNLSFTVAPVNDAPVAAADSFVVAEDGSIAIDVRANDGDVDAGTVLTVTAIDGVAIVAGGPAVTVAGGAVTLDTQGRVVFTAAPDFSGPVSFAYTVRDQAGATATAAVTGSVTPVADPVTNIAPATAALAEDTRILFGAGSGRPLAVTNPDGDVLTITISATGGVLTLSGIAGLSFANGDGSSDAAMTFSGSAEAINAALEGLAFDPAADRNGTATIVLETVRASDGASDRDVIALTISPVADITPDSITGTEDTPVVFNVLTGAGGASPDSFEDGGRVVTAVTQPPAGQGSVAFAADGTITYTPAPDFTGTASFTYTVSSGGVTETATVTVTVNAVNDAPTLDLDGASAGSGYRGTYLENGAGAPITGVGAVVADIDSTALARAVIRIGNGYAGDVLGTAALPAGITAVYDPGNFTLILSGAASVADYRAALEAVRFSSTSNNPATATRLISVSVDDGALASAPALAEIAVVPVNDAPSGANAVLAATEDTPYTFAAADFGFTDTAEGDAFAGVTITTAPADGVLLLNGVPVGNGTFVTAAQLAAGQLSWQAAADVTGTGRGQFTFQVRDAGGTANGGVDTDPSPRTISFTVAPVNDAPVSADASVTVAEDNVLNGQLPGYIDADGDVASYRAGAAAPANGTVTINPDGSYRYVPRANFAGGDLFSFVVDDGRGGTVEQFVTVTVTPVNDAPALVSSLPDRAGLDGADMDFDASSYFADTADGDTLRFTATGLPAGLSIDANGRITGTIDRAASQGGVAGAYTVTITASDPGGASVSDSFRFTVTNPAPVAVDDTATTAEDTPVSLNVLDGSAGGRDSDSDGDPLTITTATATRGTVTIAGGTLTYTPDANFNGVDTIIYTISDGNGGTAQAAVAVTVTAVNDAPTSIPAASEQRNDGDILSFDASGQFADADGDPLTYSATGLPPGLSIDPATGIISGTIAPDASGPSGSRSYAATIVADDGRGGQAAITIAYQIVNIAPTAGDDRASVAEDGSVDIAVLANDSDADADTTRILRVNNQLLVLDGAAVDTANGRVQLVSAGGQQVLRFTPDADYNGAESFTYTIDDGNSGQDTAIVNVTVTPVNDAPVSPQPIPNWVRADGQSFGFDAGDFFTDPDGDSLTFSVVGLPAGVSFDPATGTISGTIDRGASRGGPAGDGVYTVTVIATDAGGLTQARGFTLTATNPGPAAANDAVTTPEDTAVVVAVLNNDADPDADPLTVTSAVAGYGVVGIQPDGTLLYTPSADFNGTDTIVYTIVDGDGGTSTASVVVTVTPVNDAPTAQPVPAIQTADDATIEFDLGSYFADVDAGTDLGYTFTGALPPGLILDPDTGRITGQLDSNASAGTPYTTTVTASDGAGGTVSTTITWNVQNLPPEAFSDTLRLSEDAGVTSGTNVLLNDIDPDNDGKLVAAVNGDPANVGLAVTGSAGGTFVVNADGSYTFDPGAAFDDLQVGESRTTVITYLLDDTDGGTDTGFITVTVDGTNDAPVAVTIPTITGVDGESFTAKPVDLSSFFSDIESDALTFTATGLPPGLTLDAAGAIAGTIDRAASQTGPYTVTVIASDGRTVAQQIFTFTIANPAPVAVNDTAATMEEMPVDIAVLGNDADPDGDALSVDAIVPPVAANGVVTINPDGTLRYVPNANYSGTDTIIYRLTDGQGGFSTGVVNVVVGPVNDSPFGSAIPATERSDGDQVMIGTSGYFTDADGDTLSFSAIGLPPGLTIDAQTGLITGTIASGASGVTGRTDYPVQVIASDGQGGSATVTFTLTAINIAPQASGDQAATLEDTAVVIAVLGNDSDVDGDGVVVIRVNGVALTIAQSVSVPDGVVTLIDDAGTPKLRFVPDADFNGSTSFTYTIGDGNGGFDDAIVTVSIAAVNDAPVVEGPIPDRSMPDGADVSFEVASFFADVDADTLIFSAAGLPPGLAFDPATGIISGTLAANASQGGAGGVYTVTISARDPAGATVLQSFAFIATNPPPVAINDTVVVAEDGSVTFDPVTGAGTTSGAAGADSDPDGDPLRVVTVAGGQPIAPGGSVALAQGTLSMDGAGRLTFTPLANVNGAVTITYTVADGNGGTAQAAITLQITPVNDAPTLDLNGTVTGADAAVTFTEGDAPVAIAAADALAADLEDDIVRIDVALAGFADGTAEVVSLGGRVALISGTPATGAITAGGDDFRYVYDGAGMLRFESAAVAGQPLAGSAVSALLRAIQYENRSDAPTAGDRTLRFTLTDAAGAGATATASVTVAPFNDAPVSTPVAAQAGADAGVVTLDLSGNFTHVDGTLGFSATGLPPGLSIDAATGIVLGTLDRSASLQSPYTVTVTATDAAGASTQQSFTWTITNPAPIAADDRATTGENAVVQGNVILNAPGQDSDPDGDPLRVTAVGGATTAVGTPVAGSAGGLFTITGGGNFTFAPGDDFDALAAGEVRESSVSYTVSDRQGGFATARLTVTVSGVNDAPTATTLPARTATDGEALVIATAAAFTDPDTGDVLSFAATGLPSGLTIDQATGEIVGTLASDASRGAPYTIVVTATDRGGQTASTTLMLSVANLAPVAQGDSATTAEDTPVSGTVAANDSDTGPDADPLSYSLVSGPANGAIVFTADGRYTYTPAADFTGIDSFTYQADDGAGGLASATVTLTIIPVNDTPVAVDDVFTVAEDSSISLDVRGNDRDLDSPALAVVAIDGIAVGSGDTVAVIGGQVTLNPGGTITFTPAADYNGAPQFSYTLSDGALTAIATVRGTVTPTDDAPRASADPVTTAEDVAATGRISASDVDGDALDFTLVTAPVNGDVQLTSDGRYTYTPNRDFSGADSFVVLVDDGRGGQVMVTVPVTVTPVDDAPVASAEPVSVSEDSAITGQIAAADPEGDPLTYALATGPEHGSVTVAADGSYRYVPDADYQGPDQFTIAVSDGRGGSVLVAVPVTVVNINDAPVASAQPLQVTEDTAAVGRVRATDIDGDTLAYTLTAAPSLGSLVLNPDGSFRYTPNPDVSGNDSFTVRISDGQGGSTTVTIPVTIAATNDAPIATAGPAQTNEETPVTGRITASDIDGDPLGFTLQTPPAKGVVTVNPDGSYRYVPATDATGADSFVVRVSDARGGTVSVTVPIAIAPVNDAPQASAPPLETSTGRPGAGRVLASDVDGDRLGFAVTSPPANGAVALAADGSYIYAPATGFTGTDQFMVTVSDGQGGSVVVTVPVTVTLNRSTADVGTLIGLGDSFALSGFAGEAEALPPALQAGPDAAATFAAPPILLHAVNSVRDLGSTPSLATAAPLLGAINGIQSLDGTDPLTSGRGAIDVVVRALDRRTILASDVDRLFGNRFDPIATPQREGFSVRSIGGDGQLVVESIVRGRTLYLELRDEGDSAPPIVDYTLRARDGRALPGWIRLDRRGLIIIERPADADELRLIVTGLRRDGTRIDLPVLVQGETGEVQRDAAPGKVARDASLAAITAQAATARETEEAALIAAFGR